MKVKEFAANIRVVKDPKGIFYSPNSTPIRKQPEGIALSLHGVGVQTQALVLFDGKEKPELVHISKLSVLK